MPIYVYRCQVCGEISEALQSFGAPYPTCPACGAFPEHMTRLIAPVSIAFKGGGFYKTDSIKPVGRSSKPAPPPPPVKLPVVD
jgi:putative FmdB family regulatory protein